MRSFDSDLQATLAHNAWPAMVEALATELGVRRRALRQLGVGYIPVVEYKKGPCYDGQWSFPERDSTGRITGFSLRNRLNGSRKTMFPGSKHGVFFAPTFGVGSHVPDERTGPRWVRVSDAGVECPVCGKPDWCLVDAADPANPAAVICPRVPSERDLGEAGYLHVLDSERSGGLVSEATDSHPLPTSSDPVIVVEGATDTAALLSLGLVAVGRPSATGGLTILASLCRGRRIVVLGENDEKTDGSWPGRWGAEKTLKALVGVCADLRVVFPPAAFKDVRQWMVQAGLSREAFMEHVEKYAATDAAGPASTSTLADDNISTVSGAILEQLYTDNDRPSILRCQESWYLYGSSGWAEEPSRESVRGEIHRFLSRSRYRDLDGRSKTITVKAFNPTTSYVRNVSEHLCAIVPNPMLPPVWIDGREGPNPKRLLCFHNGTLDIEDYILGQCALTPYTSDLFITARLPFDFTEQASCPRWMDWLQETLGDDPNKIDLLQEWFGYNLIHDNQYEKMLMMLGPRRSGKGTALTVLMNLLGPAAQATSLKSFGQNFGLHHLIGKLAAIMPDAITPESGQKQCLQTLLEIIGNDHVQIDRKFKTALSHRLTVRVTIAANQMPNLPDDSLALAARMMVISFTRSFIGCEETGLKEHLTCEEMPGIALWALEGLKRLTETGVFTQPADADLMEEDFTNLVCPIAEFAETWVHQSPDAVVPLDTLFEAWKVYSDERNTHRRNRQWLYSQLKVRYPRISRETEVRDGHTVKLVRGLDLHGFAPNARGHRS